ncbi:mucin-like protein 3 [Mesocricetus auratus]|uniref:Mucin-like protein 3 n=1 Tax=Mesocricetus auratus TaxID=10036 RepID=A0A3Q0CHC6_MESAU|nr:mucin-like protein 3 [Mesocricetus auratus]
MTQLRSPIIRAPLWVGQLHLLKAYLRTASAPMTSNLTPYKMQGPRPVVLQQPPSSDMAQLTSGFCSTFGFICCLLFLPASWEAGANTFQGPQKTGEPSTPDHLLTLTPGLPHRSPSAHADLDPGQRPSALPKSTVTQKPKKPCNTVRFAKPVHKPIDNSKAADNQNTTAHHEMTPAVEKNASSQRRDPMTRNGRSADDPKSTNTEKASGGSQSTSAPRRRTTCKSTTSKIRVTRNSDTASRPVDTSTRQRTTSYKPTTPSHDSELSRKTTPSSGKSSGAPRTSHRTPRTPATTEAGDHRTPFTSDKPVQITTEHTKEITSAGDKTTRTQVTLEDHEGENISTSDRTTGSHATATQSEREPQPASDRTTRSRATATQSEREPQPASDRTTGAQATSTEHEGETISANERTTGTQLMPLGPDTTPAQVKTTRVSAKSTEHPEEAAPTPQEATQDSESPTVFWRKTTPATVAIRTTGNPEKTVAVLATTGPPARTTEGKSTARSPHFHKTETTRRGLLGSVTTRTDLGPVPSETQHPQQSSHSSPGGLHAAGASRDGSSFPAWAIVVVILLAVIVLLICIGLIVLVACAWRTRRVPAQDSEDFDPEDRGGRNSYPVYLMEQQNLKPNQIPSPP